MEHCLWCEEPVLPSEPQESVRLITRDGIKLRVEHLACAARAVIGSVAHLERRCGCYVPGAEEGDDPALTKRQAAEAALALWRQQQTRWER